MRLNRYFLIIVLFLNLSSHSLAQAPWERKDTPLDKLARNGIVLDRKTPEIELVRTYGTPLGTKKDEVSIDGYDFKDTVVFYQYPGLEIWYYYHKHPKKAWTSIVSVIVDSHDYQIGAGIKIGMSQKEFEKSFGNLMELKSEDDNLLHLTYTPFDAVHEQIHFFFEKSKLAKVTWSNWP